MSKAISLLRTSSVAVTHISEFQYSITQCDQLLTIDACNNPVTLVLPNISTINIGQIFTIVDITSSPGVFNSNKISVLPDSTDMIINPYRGVETISSLTFDNNYKEGSGGGKISPTSYKLCAVSKNQWALI